MIIVPPIRVTDSTLNSSNVLENDNPEWMAGSYALSARVMVATGTPNIHRNYESLVAANTADPVADQLTGGANWLDLGPTNRWAMFDDVNGTQTENFELIETEVTFGTITNAVAVLNVSAATVQVILTDPIEGEVYNETRELISNSGVNDWYAYYFTPIERSSNAAFLDLPAYSQATLKMIAQEGGSDVKVGVLAAGTQTTVGITDYGTSTGLRDYSRKETDSFGNFVVVQRAFSKRADYAITLETARTAFVQQLLAEIRTVPVIWIGQEDFGATIVYGYYRNFDIVLSGPVISDCNISVEGLT